MELEEIKLAVSPYLEKLKAMDTPGQIADFLAAEGVKATPQDNTSCAIAEYVRNSSGVGVVVELNYTATGVPCTREFCWDRRRHGECNKPVAGVPVGEHSEAMRLFVNNFDNGEYPDLEA